MNKTAIAVILLVAILALSFGISCALANPAYLDEFDGPPLQPFWTTSGKAGSTFSLTANPGNLVVTSPSGTDLGGLTDDAPKVLQPVTGDFSAITMVSGDFSVVGSHAGLLIYIDNSHFMRLERRDGQKIQLGGKDGGAFIYNQYTLPTNLNPTHLKLVKSGNVISGYWSTDGNSWNLLSWTEPFNGVGTVQIGLFVIAQSASFSAAFDFFHAVPGDLFVVPESALGTIAVPIAMGAAFIVYRRSKRSKT